MRRLVCWIRGHRRRKKVVVVKGGARLVSHCGRCDRVFWGLE